MTKKRQQGRNVSGILLLDKPIGLTSNGALQRVKRLFNAKKAGHTGSLDPLATGMLPICFGQATKFSEYLLMADKSYVVKAQFGVKTTTSDAEGEVVQTRPVPLLIIDDIDRACDDFRGDINQVPSMFSALKFEGKPLYEYARQGITIERPARQVTIYELTLLDYDATLTQLTCRVRCSKGTYIRNLMEDLGDALGCGAHVIELRRLTVGGFPVDEMVTMAELEQAVDEKGLAGLDSYVIPVSRAAAHLPILKLDQVRYLNLKQGKTVEALCGDDIIGKVQLHSKQGEFLGVAQVIEGRKLKPVRLIK